MARKNSTAEQKAAAAKYQREFRAGLRRPALIGAKRNPYRTAYMRKFRGMPEPTRACPPACECCGKPPGKRALSLDHCHDTGAFRGWLCGNCNTSIGKLGDNEAGVMNALNYLRRSVG